LEAINAIGALQVQNFYCPNYRECVYNCRKYRENNREVIEN
jgi:hypothetical protein